MAHSINFDTPASSTVYDVLATGTVAAWTTGHVMVQLTITGTNPARSSTQKMFYRENDYDNTTSSQPLVVSDNFQIAITPMLHGTDSVIENVWFSYPGTSPS